MRNIGWKDFENSSEDLKAKFEALCRVFFRYHFVKEPNCNLVQKTNNPGLECEPINIDGVNVGFQSKHFSKNIKYKDIYDSAETIVKSYNGKVDRVILFCNQDLDINAKQYKDAVALLLECNIELEPFCNENILDAIRTDNYFSPIREYFFGELYFSNDELTEIMKSQLNDLLPRYNNSFHVELPEIENNFSIIYEDEKGITNLLNNLIEGWKSNIKVLIDLPKAIKNKILAELRALQIPQKARFSEIFEWYKKFDPYKLDIDKALFDNENNRKNNEAELDKAVDYQKLNKLNEELKKLSCKYYSLMNAKEILANIDLSRNSVFKNYGKKIFIVEGAGGIGKSHLLGYISEKYNNNDEHNTILVLGQKLAFSDAPEEQIMKSLGLSKWTFDQFIDACEAKGQATNCNTVIILDAINESVKYEKWKNYINSFINKIENKNHVKFVFSIRDTFKEEIFSDTLKGLISQEEVASINHYGFEQNMDEAIQAFFAYHNIPLNLNISLRKEFVNPLHLKIFCESYSDKAKLSEYNFYHHYEIYIKKIEDKIKQINSITERLPVVKNILKQIGKYFYENNMTHIELEELYNIVNQLNGESKYLFLEGMLKEKLLVSYSNEDIVYVYMSFERLAEYLIAKHIISLSEDYNDIKEIIKNYLFKKDENNFLKHHNAVGIFGILSVLVAEKYNEEIIEILSDFNPVSVYEENIITKLILEYINGYLFRRDKDVSKSKYTNIANRYFKNDKTFFAHIELMIKIACGNTELNAYYFSDWLRSFSLAQRDHFWTIYINDKYEKGKSVYAIINQLMKNKNQNSHEDILKIGQLLCWFLTSSNRQLRDKASRALVNLLGKDIKSMINLLEIFIEVNDPYIISRLFGCVYGAVLTISKKELDLAEFKGLCSFVYENIFNKDEVYPDVLLRDYALNIIEYAKHLKVTLDFDIESCRPPYNSRAIVEVGIEEVEELYPKWESGAEFKGTYYIKSSMAPDGYMGDFAHSYGDFGRYVFQRVISDFKDVNIKKCFCYAYKYIIKELGYSNDIFSKYDKSIGSGRARSTYPIERIGKKYQWIAMYHTLALITDKYKLEEKFTDKQSSEYKGTWSPYVRDFDPTLTISSKKEKHDIDISLQRNIYSNWNLEDNDWAEREEGMYNFSEIIEIKDSKNDEWVALHFANTDASYTDYEEKNQSIWKSATACLINKKSKDKFIEAMKEKHFWGRWLNAAEVGSNYTLFSREYSWSPGYRDEYGENDFSDVELKVGKQAVKKKGGALEKLMYLKNSDGFNYEEFLEKLKNMVEDEEVYEYETEENIMKVVGTIAPCCNSYLWEEECDLGKDEAISYLMPSARLIQALGLEQKLNGVWFIDNKAVCADFSLIKGCNISGLYIRKDVFQRFLDVNDFDVVWIGLGEKNFIKSTYGEGNIFNNISSLVYRKGTTLVEINHVEKR